ncbi:MAG TPA: hypothetical protein DF480_01785, partial [Clostridiales bacterium]|nr:hypothetical protein [Clostridiales bacterium]
IIRVAETFDAKTNSIGDDSVSPEEALEIIRALAGKRFDPAVVEAFAKVLSRRKTGAGNASKND